MIKLGEIHQYYQNLALSKADAENIINRAFMLEENYVLADLAQDAEITFPPE